MLHIKTKAKQTILVGRKIMRVKEVRKNPRSKIEFNLAGKATKLRLGDAPVQALPGVYVKLCCVQGRAAHLAFAVPGAVRVESLDHALRSAWAELNKAA